MSDDVRQSGQLASLRKRAFRLQSHWAQSSKSHESNAAKTARFTPDRSGLRLEGLFSILDKQS
jgi:hypothetical protein